MDRCYIAKNLMDRMVTTGSAAIDAGIDLDTDQAYQAAVTDCRAHLVECDVCLAAMRELLNHALEMDHEQIT